MFGCLLVNTLSCLKPALPEYINYTLELSASRGRLKIAMPPAKFTRSDNTFNHSPTKLSYYSLWPLIYYLKPVPDFIQRQNAPVMWNNKWLTLNFCIHSRQLNLSIYGPTNTQATRPPPIMTCCKTTPVSAITLRSAIKTASNYCNGFQSLVDLRRKWSSF